MVMIKQNPNIDICAMIYDVATDRVEKFQTKDKTHMNFKEIKEIIETIRKGSNEYLLKDIFKLLKIIKGKYYCSFKEYKKSNGNPHHDKLIIKYDEFKKPIIKEKFDIFLIIKEIHLFCGSEEKFNNLCDDTQEEEK